MMAHSVPRRVLLLLPMLSSSVDAEALATRDALVRTLADAGLDLHDLAELLSARSEMSSAMSARAPTPTFFDMARACRDLDCGRLTIAEKRFVGNMVKLGRTAPTRRQAEWLADIYSRVGSRRTA